MQSCFRKWECLAYLSVKFNFLVWFYGKVEGISLRDLLLNIACFGISISLLWRSMADHQARMFWPKGISHAMSWPRGWNVFYEGVRCAHRGSELVLIYGILVGC